MSFQRGKTLAAPYTGSSAEASASFRKLFKRSDPSGGTSAVIVILSIVAIAAVAIWLWRRNNQEYQDQGTIYSAYSESPVPVNQNVQLPPSPLSTSQYPPPTHSPGARNVQLPPSPSSALQYLPSAHSPYSLNRAVSLVRSSPWPTPPVESVSVRQTRTDTPWYSYEEKTVSTPTTFAGRSVLSTPEASHVETLFIASPRSSPYSSPVRSMSPVTAASNGTRFISPNPPNNVRTA
jgi:cytoskeletal protein RodZ